VTARNKRLLRWIGYPALTLFVFVMTVHLSFPYGRIKDKIVGALSSEYDVTIESVGPGIFPGRMVIKGMTLTTRPTQEGVKPVTLLVDRLKVNVGILALLGKKVSIKVDAILGDGEVRGRIDRSEDETVIDIATKDLPLDSIPGAAVLTGGAPITGGLEAKLSIRLPQGKWAAADGKIEIACADCTIGDGATKVRPVVPGQTNAFTGEGFTLPKIKLGQVDGKIVITKGIACIETFHTKSPHGELKVDGGIRLADPFPQSSVQLYARFMLSDLFRKESPRNLDFDVLFTAGAKQPDGWSNYMARTTVGQLRWLLAKFPPPPMKECAGVAPSQPTLPPSANLPLPPSRLGANGAMPPGATGPIAAPVAVPGPAPRAGESEPFKPEPDAAPSAAPPPPAPTQETVPPPAMVPTEPPVPVPPPQPEAPHAEPPPAEAAPQPAPAPYPQPEQ
jgi:type II secretion system protein N